MRINSCLAFILIGVDYVRHEVELVALVINSPLVGDLCAAGYLGGMFSSREIPMVVWSARAPPEGAPTYPLVLCIFRAPVCCDCHFWWVAFLFIWWGLRSVDLLCTTARHQ